LNAQNLILDFGNTALKVAVFQNSELIHFQKIPNTEVCIIPKLEECIAPYKNISATIISSVTDIKAEVLSFLQKSFPLVLQLSETTKIPISSLYKTPQTFGKDRLAALVGTFSEFKNQNLLIVDAGTAITFDVLTAENKFIGGNIASGLYMRFKALHHFTSKLPLVQPHNEFSLLGLSTEEAIVCGVQNGLLFEIEGYYNNLSKIYQNLIVIFTGGDADFLQKKSKIPSILRPHLVLFGLNFLLNYNLNKD